MFFFDLLSSLNDSIWKYAALLVVGLGCYFTFKTRAFQLRQFPRVLRGFLTSSDEHHKDSTGVPPLQAFITAMGGSIGIGNVVGICTAIQIGGPGALFWTWVAGFLGMLLQYSEVYLGMKHRVANDKGGYDGGPMYFLPKAFKWKRIAQISALLLCLYGVELFMFNVITDSVVSNWHINRFLVVGGILVLVLLVVKGGVKRISKICSSVLPLFLLAYSGMACWILFKNAGQIPHALSMIISGAFTTQGAVGGFAGSTVLLTIAMGMSRGAYAGDIGIGYNSVIHTESSSSQPQKQASLTMVGIVFNTFILCSISTFLVLLTGTWNSTTDVTLMIQNALSQYFPYMQYFMPIFLFLLGYLTITTYFFVGSKCASFLSPKRGKFYYSIYASFALPLFAFVNPAHAFVVMSLAGALLLLLNLTGIFLLRKEVRFHVD